jgi:hypothetical protein
MNWSKLCGVKEFESICEHVGRFSRACKQTDVMHIFPVVDYANKNRNFTSYDATKSLPHRAEKIRLGAPPFLL